MICAVASVSSEPRPGDEGGDDRLQCQRDADDGSRPRWRERGDREPERRDRADQDRAEGERPDRRRQVIEVALERDLLGELSVGKLHHGLDDGPHERREQEREEEDAQGFSLLDRALAREQVRRQRDRRADAGDDADGVEVQPSQNSDTSARPTSVKAKAAHTRGRTSACHTSLAQSTTRTMPENWINSAIPIGSRSMATKYSHWTSANEKIP